MRRGNVLKCTEMVATNEMKKSGSFFSLLIYLNEGYEGGETYFEEGITITPKVGEALIFHHPLKARGKALNLWNKICIENGHNV